MQKCFITYSLLVFQAVHSHDLCFYTGFTNSYIIRGKERGVHTSVSKKDLLLPKEQNDCPGKIIHCNMWKKETDLFSHLKYLVMAGL